MTVEDLEETAGLAHLNVQRDALSAALPAFEQMLTFFALMQGADENLGAGVQAGQAAGARLVGADHFRGDAAPLGSDSGALSSINNTTNTVNEHILNNAGDRDGRFIVIPNVL
jgi:aspartyl-tRNA(Asn)/glutamyl-tRNA(Gln) amidotransferase subunit C